MKFRLALAAATCLALPLAAQAQPVTGPYVSLGAGTSLSQPLDYSYTNHAGQSGHFDTRPSYAGAFSAGYGFGNGFRVELSGNYYRNTVHKDDASSGMQYAATGGVNTYGLMANALYDFNVNLPIYPYLGAGLGYQWQQLSSHINDVSSFKHTISGTTGSFAYNLIAGLSYPLPWVQGLSLTAEYRFMQLADSRKYNATSVNTGADGSTKLGRPFVHTFLIGLRYQIFNPPPPPPAPAPAPAPMAAPAPAPAKTYLVFFDWDKYNVTPRAAQIIAQSASDSKTQNVTTLDVSGYTDTSGTPK
ncbi:MAG TPA: outer membrane beta-barrel protein, partial [Acidocella sp.]|nr:outer membrane beta-barrel protein [Acidocella sp.]